MGAGTVIEVKRLGTDEAVPVEVVQGDLEERYEQLVALALRIGHWLTGPQARLLSAEEWEAHFFRYQDRLEELRRLGDELRPRVLRDPEELLMGDALVEEVVELFAA